MSLTNNQQAFFALLRAGLWESEVQLSQFEDIDYKEIYRLAEEQSVVGIVAAGIEHITDVKPPQQIALLFAGVAVQTEQRNLAMNEFLAGLTTQLRNENLNAILVKGQGVAQCYERPLLRSSGDIDFFLEKESYPAVKQFFDSISDEIEKEKTELLHQAYIIDSWDVELHGTLHSGLWNSVEKGLDDLQEDTFKNEQVRVWRDGNVNILLPSANNDSIFIFTHILQHFFKGGIGLRQICDWCRLLSTYKELLDHSLLERRLMKMGLMSEWKAFAALAVDYLGISTDDIPFYENKKRWSSKANRITSFIFNTGNFGHNIDRSYIYKHHFIIRKLITYKRELADIMHHFFIFPKDSSLLIVKITIGGISKLLRSY